MALEKWPEIPARYDGLLGEITVLRVAQVDEQDNQGEWDADARIIRVKISRSRINEWFVFWHEVMHSILDDMVIEFPSEEGVGSLLERTCDAFAQARVREMARRLGRKRVPKVTGRSGKQA